MYKIEEIIKAIKPQDIVVVEELEFLTNHKYNVIEAVKNKDKDFLKELDKINADPQLSNHIKVYTERYNTSLKDIAKYLGIAEQTAKGYSSGKAIPLYIKRSIILMDALKHYKKHTTA